MDIKGLMKKKKITGLKLAKEIGANPAQVYLFLGGYIPLPQKYHSKLNAFLGIDIEEFKKVSGGKE